MEMLPIDRALDEYALNLKALDAVQSQKKLRSEQVLSVLVARDEVQRSMGADDRDYSVATVQRLIELDERLRKAAGRMARVVRARELEWWLEQVVNYRLAILIDDRIKLY